MLCNAMNEFLLLFSQLSICQVKEDLYKRRQAVVKIDGDSICSLCHKRIANSAFAIYANGETLVHFVCFRESQQIKAVRGGNSVKRR
jgi:Vam6/Vps39-like protein vacuolar protein sorting-associated protein 39